MPDLSNVKTGDKLYVPGRFEGGSILTVQRITPTGRIVTENGTFMPNGRLVGASGWDVTHGRPATPEDIENVRQSKILHRLKATKWAEVSPETRDAIVQLLNSAKAQKS